MYSSRCLLGIPGSTPRVRANPVYRYPGVCRPCGPRTGSGAVVGKDPDKRAASSSLGGGGEYGNTVCPLCGSAGPRPYLLAPRMDRLPGEEYTYLRCPGCGFVFLDLAIEVAADHYDESGYYSRRRPLLSGPIEVVADGFSRLRLGRSP